MKRIILLFTALVFSVSTYTQNRPLIPKYHRRNNIDLKGEIPDNLKNRVPMVSTFFDPEEEFIGHTWYDLQTNGACQNRIYYYEDGTIGAAWTQSVESYIFQDRGTGYNYFDGNEWDEFPTERIESQRTGWPSYSPLGEEGEIVIAHISGGNDDGLLINRRTLKGTSDWMETLFQGPPGHEKIFWPRMVTGGNNYNNVYLIVLTAPTANGGIIYEGLNGALLYSRSTDGGEIWDINNQILPGMTSDEYTGFTGDCYSFAEPKDSLVAFVVGSYQHDMFLMKSVDYGQTFEKSLIWDNPYDSITLTVQTDTFYCVDGSIDVELDNNGMAHVVFGIISTYYDIQFSYWRFYKNTDGVGYWNENMPSFSSDINALNPYGHPDSELIPDYNLIGWAQDIDGDGEITYVSNYFGYMNSGISSMVQLVIDDMNRLFLFFTSVTETFDDGMMNYRRLWSRSSTDGGQNWGQFYHFIPDDPWSIYTECSYPSCAPRSDDYLYLVYQSDYEPGIYNLPQEHTTENIMRFVKISKDEIVGIKQPNQLIQDFNVSQNYPNPFNSTSTVKVNLRNPAELSLEVVNLMGQKVYEINSGVARQGMNKLIINAVGLTPGVYFYSVKAGESTVTKKMIVE